MESQEGYFGRCQCDRCHRHPHSRAAREEYLEAGKQCSDSSSETTAAITNIAIKRFIDATTAIRKRKSWWIIVATIITTTTKCEKTTKNSASCCSPNCSANAAISSDY